MGANIIFKFIVLLLRDSQQVIMLRCKFCKVLDGDKRIAMNIKYNISCTVGLVHHKSRAFTSIFGA